MKGRKEESRMGRGVVDEDTKADLLARLLLYRLLSSRCYRLFTFRRFIYRLFTFRRFIYRLFTFRLNVRARRSLLVRPSCAISGSYRVSAALAQ